MNRLGTAFRLNRYKNKCTGLFTKLLLRTLSSKAFIAPFKNVSCRKLKVFSDLFKDPKIIKHRAGAPLKDLSLSKVSNALFKKPLNSKAIVRLPKAIPPIVLVRLPVPMTNTGTTSEDAKASIYKNQKKQELKCPCFFNFRSLILFYRNIQNTS